EHTIPGTSALRLAYIGAVHPRDPDRAFVRVDDPDGTVVLATSDGGATFQTLFHGKGTLFGFALSAGGDRLPPGGPADGLWAGPGGGRSDGTAFERRADVGPSCLAWDGAALLACADESTAGFSLGRSRDEGSTFEPLLRFSELCGDVACQGESQVGMHCGGAW